MVLRKYGGIYLDSDSYVVKSLDKYRRYETAIGWPPGQYIGSQVIVAHKKSEFLRLYYESYRKYRPDLWYYNAGELPTQEILGPQLHLVYRIPCDFGVHEDITRTLYEQCNDDWRNYTAVHVFFRLRSHYCPLDKFGPINFETVGRLRAVEFSMCDISARMHCLAERSKIGQTVTGKYANAMRVSNSTAAATARPTFFRFISFETSAPNLRQTVPKGDAASVRVVRSTPAKQRKVSTVRD
ncbi:hypothetical protein HPB50_027558 [Hyalomma asiaticum]|uniref:Uncharacterized protein n=1 Tax=Hyalomma asiaticum TaxID=266040 RepID=A0ACB7SZU8_HYAAI|nr:hypothetical protein HPB50_027558 [Hyalomma asiaticum]